MILFVVAVLAFIFYDNFEECVTKANYDNFIRKKYDRQNRRY